MLKHSYKLLQMIYPVLGVLVVAMLLLTSDVSTADARSKQSGVFGTVVKIHGDHEALDVATRRGVITLEVTDKTKVRGKSKRFDVYDIAKGMTVAGYYYRGDDEDDEELVAGNLTFHQKKDKKKKKHEHVIGVVVDTDDDDIVVETIDGEEVTVDVGEVEQPEDDPVEDGDMVVVVVEEDPDTGDLTATALETAQSTIDRLNDAISHELSVAQQSLLKIRLEETASIHLTRLYDRLDEIEAETRAQVQAAYDEFESNYRATLAGHRIESSFIQITGLVVAVSKNRIVVENEFGNKAWIFTLTNETVIHDEFGGDITFWGIDLADRVEVFATPVGENQNPHADRIFVISAPEGGAGGDPEPEGDGPIKGEIVVVEDGDDGTIVVIETPDGDETVEIPEDTTVVVDGEEQSAEDLEPGQEVVVEVGDDGFSAEEVDASTPDPDDESENNDGENSNSSGGSGSALSLIGIISSITESGYLLDDVYFEYDPGLEQPGDLEVGSEVEFDVTKDPSGKWKINQLGKKNNGQGNGNSNAGGNGNGNNP